MELRELAAFREVARQSSFSKAALRLGYVQSTISAQIHALESELGVRLFDRLGRTVVLTVAGDALFPHAEQLLELSDQARASVAAAVVGEGRVEGSIVVSAPESLLTYRLPTVLSTFRARYPGVAIVLRPTPVGRFRGQTRQAVASGDVDVAFVLDAPLGISGFHTERLLREPISVIAASGHRLASVKGVGAADLDGEALLLPEAPESGCAYRAQFERHLGEGGVSTNGALEFASIEAIKQCVVAGMGVSVLPSVAVETEVIAGRLTRLPWHEPFEVYTQLVWSLRRSVRPAMAAFIEVSQTTLGVG
jgi:DNA-binding transcriptional LysR family regulator